MRLIITGGGTGGHLFPGIALAKGMQMRLAGCRVLFIGTGRQMDRETLAGYDFEFAGRRQPLTHRLFHLPTRGLPRASIKRASKLFFSFFPSLCFDHDAPITDGRTKGYMSGIKIQFCDPKSSISLNRQSGIKMAPSMI